jgi:cytidylate kinase
MRKIFEIINQNLSRLQFFKNKRSQSSVLPVITISREKRAGGRTIAYMVAKKLGRPWKVYDKEIIDEIAKKEKLEKKLIEEIDEKRLSAVDQLINDFFGKRYLSLTRYYKSLVKVISEIAHRGYAIIVGRGADYLIPHALKIRILGDMEHRINIAMKYDKLSREKAIEFLKKCDQERDEFIKSLYHHDPKKAHHYDLVIKIGPNLSLEDATDLIVRLAKKRFKL